MSKRRAEHQLTDRDDPDAVSDDPGVYTAASAEVMATRKIVRGKRRNAPKTAEPATAPSDTVPSVLAAEATPTEAKTDAASPVKPAAGWPSFNFPGVSATTPSWPTFSFTSAAPTASETVEAKGEETPATPTVASAWPTFSFKTDSGEAKGEESPAQPTFSFASTTPWPSFSTPGTSGTEKKEGEATSIFSWPTFTFTPSADKEKTAESPAKPSLSWPSLSNPLAPAQGETKTPDVLSSIQHYDLTTLGAGKQEALSLTNAGTGILGVNVAAPKTSADGEPAAAASFSAAVSPSKLTKVEEQKTGEEGEYVEFKARVKLYQWNGEAWNERGVGLLKLNYNEEKNTSRFIMRGDPTGRLLLNFPIFAQMVFSKQSAKVLRIAGFNHTGETQEVKPEQFSIRFMSEDETSQCFSALKLAIDRASPNGAGSATEEKTPETVAEKKAEEKETKEETA